MQTKSKQFSKKMQKIFTFFCDPDLRFCPGGFTATRGATGAVLATRRGSATHRGR